MSEMTDREIRAKALEIAFDRSNALIQASAIGKCDFEIKSDFIYSQADHLAAYIKSGKHPENGYEIHIKT